MMIHTEPQHLNQVVKEMKDHLNQDEYAEIEETINALEPVQVIKVLSRLSHRHRAIVYRLLEKDVALTVFEGLSPALQSDLLGALQEHETAEVFLEMSPAQRVWLLDELPAKVASKLLLGLDVEERNQTSTLLGYPDEAIGRRMSPRFVALEAQRTVAEARQYVDEELATAETVYYLPVVNDGRRVLGEITLRSLLRSDDAKVLKDIMRPTHTAYVTENAETVARRITRQGAFATAIVDDEQRLVGIFTLDDAARILEYEESQDVSRQGGVEALRRPYLSTPVLRLVRSRITWLLVLAIGGTLTVQVLSVFEDSLEQVTALALFVPLLIGIGGNTGNQAATTVTRALALHDVEPRDVFRVLTREVRTGFCLGLLLGTLGLVITGFIFDFDVGLIIGLTLLAICCVAASVGGVMPLIAKKIKVDPAVFSNPFISTFVDATGLIIYFLIARAILGI
ncbi:magnesium transporter [Enteractinococcus coprophilus]|nr:magnesium transporter [Enteractinococcus coprophilus]